MTPSYEHLSDGAMLQTLNSNTTFEAYQRAKVGAQRVRGGMYWKTQGDYEYLVRTTADNKQTRIGPRSPQTEAIFASFMERKEQAEGRLASLSEALGEAERLNRAQRAGRVPNIVVELLSRLDKERLSEHFTVVGTHALYAYEAAAGVRIVPSALATQDVDLLWDARKRVSFVTDLARTEDQSILRILQRVDKTFERKDLSNETAVNAQGFEVDFLRREQQQDDPHPWRFSQDEGDLWPVQARRAGLLTEAPRFSTPVIALNGSMAMMQTISPGAFVDFKRWLAQAPDRNPLKRQRDERQAEIVSEMLTKGILMEQHAPTITEASRATRSEEQIRAEILALGLNLRGTSGEDAHRYVGQVVAATEFHVAQDIGRKNAVIHDVRSLSEQPRVGDMLDIQFRNGKGQISKEPGKSRER